MLEKMFRNELLAEWIILIIVGVLLIFLYGSNVEELVKRVLEWIFVATSFKLIIDYGMLPRLKERFEKQ